MAIMSFPFLWQLFHVSTETPSEWIDDNVYLTKEASHKDGKFSTSYTPYIRGPQNAFPEHAISEMTICAGTQVLKTQLFLNTKSWAIGNRPGPVLYVMPTKDTTNKFIRKRFITQMQNSPKLLQYFKDDLGKGTNQLFELNNEMNIAFGWAGSTAALSSDSIRYLFLDEVDKFKGRLGHEASPFKLAGERLKAFTGKSKLMVASTPTRTDGLIWQRLNSSIQHQYYVPCPHCNKFQILIFDNVRKPKDVTDPDALKHTPTAWYKCRFCRDRIQDRHKAKMLREGYWKVNASDLKRFDFEINSDGIALAPHVGFHISSIYAPWITFSTVMAEYMSSEKTVNAQGYKLLETEVSTNRQNFYNSWLGLPYEEEVHRPIEVKQKVISGMLNSRGKIPKEAGMLSCVIDVHGMERGWYASLWAYGHGRRGWLVDYWRFKSTKETTKEWLEDISTQIDETILNREWKTEDGRLLLLYTGIDSGYKGQDKDHADPGDNKAMSKENQAYDFARGRPRCWALKGDDQTNRHELIWDSKTMKTETKFFKLLIVNTGKVKEEFSKKYNNGMQLALENIDKEISYVQLANGAQGEFLQSMSSEHAVEEDGKIVWKVRHGYMNHYWDTAVNAMAVAELNGWARLLDLSSLKNEGQNISTASSSGSSGSGRFSGPRGGMGGRRK